MRTWTGAKSRNGEGMSAKKPKMKRSAKANAQRADKAYAEFEKLTRHVKPARSEIETEGTTTNGDQPSR